MSRRLTQAVMALVVMAAVAACQPPPGSQSSKQSVALERIADALETIAAQDCR